MLDYSTFCSIYIVIHSFSLMFRSINHRETIPIVSSWLDMTKKTIFGLTRLQSTWWDSLHLYCDSLHLTWFAPFKLWFTPLDMIRSIYILIHSLNLDKSRFDLIQLDSTRFDKNRLDLTRLDYKEPIKSLIQPKMSPEIALKRFT